MHIQDERTDTNSNDYEATTRGRARQVTPDGTVNQGSILRKLLLDRRLVVVCKQTNTATLIKSQRKEFILTTIACSFPAPN